MRRCPQSLTPGGGLKNRDRSAIQLGSKETANFKPCSVTFTLDSFAIVSGTVKDLKVSMMAFCVLSP